MDLQKNTIAMKPQLELLQLHLIDADIRSEPSTLPTTDYPRSPNIVMAKRSAPVFTSANSGPPSRANNKTKKPATTRRLTSTTNQSVKRLDDDEMQDFIVDNDEAESTEDEVTSDDEDSHHAMSERELKRALKAIRQKRKRS